MKLFGDLGTSLDALRAARPDVNVTWTPPREKPGELVGVVYVRPPLEGRTDWWISEDLTDLLGTRTNADAERRLIARLRLEEPALLARLDFDTEGDAVTVMAKTKEDAIAVAGVIERMATG